MKENLKYWGYKIVNKKISSEAVFAFLNYVKKAII